MALPNPTAPIADDLRFLWSQATGTSDLVTGGTYTVMGTAPTVITTPDGAALQGNGVGYVTFGTRTDLATQGTSTQSILVLARIVDSSTAAGHFLGKTQSDYSIAVEISSASQTFDGRVKNVAVAVPSPSGAGALLPYNGKTVAILAVYTGTQQFTYVKALGEGAIASSSAALTGSFPEDTGPLSLLARGNAADQLNSGAAVLAAGIWGRALTVPERESLLNDPKQLFRGPDLDPPTLTGEITVTNITQSGYDLAWPAGADTVGVAGYEVSLNGGTTWASNGLVRTLSVGGRTSGALDAVQVRAVDSDGNFSTPPLSTTVQVEFPGLLGSTIKSTSGLGTHGSGFLYTNVLAGDEGKRFSYVITRQPSVGSLIAYPDGSFVYNGAANAAASFGYVMTVDGTAFAEKTVSLNFDAPPDVIAPVLSSPTAAATGLSSATGTVTTDEAAGKLYSYASANPTETAATIVALGAVQNVMAAGVQNVSFAGLNDGTTYYAHYVQKDPDLNTSAVVKSVAFTTPADVYLTLGPAKNNTGTVLTNQTNATVHVYSVPSGDKVKTFTGVSTNASGMVSLKGGLSKVPYRSVFVSETGAAGLQEATAV